MAAEAVARAVVVTEADVDFFTVSTDVSIGAVGKEQCQLCHNRLACDMKECQCQPVCNILECDGSGIPDIQCQPFCNILACNVEECWESDDTGISSITKQT